MGASFPPPAPFFLLAPFGKRTQRTMCRRRCATLFSSSSLPPLFGAEAGARREIDLTGAALPLFFPP